MGFKAYATTGMVVINWNAIADVTIGASEKYQDEDSAGAIHSVRVKGGIDVNLVCYNFITLIMISVLTVLKSLQL
jgi:hypothetical protein